MLGIAILIVINTICVLVCGKYTLKAYTEMRCGLVIIGIIGILVNILSVILNFVKFVEML